MSESMEPRAVSEVAGVAVLVALTVAATASVGLTVVFVIEDDDPFGAQFSFDHSDDLDQLLVFYDAGDELPADEIYLVGPDGEVTWAEVDDRTDETVEPSNVPIRLHADTAYGSTVGPDDFFEIRYVPDGDDEDETVLASWNAPDEGADDEFVEPPAG